MVELLFVSVLLFIVLTFILGRKLHTAGDELGNNSLRQAGSIILFLLLVVRETGSQRIQLRAI